MSNASGRRPRALAEILGELFTIRGYGRLFARQELEDAWNRAVGTSFSQQTRLGEVRRGVLNVTVANSTLLEELAAFRKPSLLEAMRTGAPGTTIHDIRFRVGPVALEIEAAHRMGSDSHAGQGNGLLSHSGVQREHTGQAHGPKSNRSSGSNPVDL
jgi:hypothetical protein